jgi:hypothetical protein
MVHEDLVYILISDSSSLVVVVVVVGVVVLVVDFAIPSDGTRLDGHHDILTLPPELLGILRSGGTQNTYLAPVFDSWRHLRPKHVV